MLYPKNKAKQIDLNLFLNPTAEYRCTPFWAWNCDLKKDELFSEIDAMEQMGMGGFHMHTRVGMSTTYLSDEYMAFIKACTERAKEKNMLAWLYDEDKWPSGFAGGYVTKKLENRQKFLMLTTTPYGDAAEAEEQIDASALAKRANNGKLLCKYAVELDDEGYLKNYRQLKNGETAEGTVWYAYLETASEGPWFNYQTYVDTLSKPAIDDFIKITHERYKETVGEEFGKTVPAIFTDEPQVTRKVLLDHAKDLNKDIILPFTTDLEESYRAAYGESLLEKLPEVIWNKKGVASVTRYRYHDHVTERFVQAYCDNIGHWCQKNGIAMTGHMMEERSLSSQTVAIGEAMRAYRNFTIPGVDILCNTYGEFTTVKQAASAAHQYGREGVMSELYGVTNWDFDFRGHKLQGDWQAALGVSVRVPHLYWVSMNGEAKRDYPASIGHQSAWYKEYSYIENHFARVNTLMTRGSAAIKIAMIHPIESYWLCYGPNDQSGGVRQELDRNFKDISNWMLHAGLDYDYICESTLPEQFKNSQTGFTVGKMCYDVVVVPGCRTLRGTTLKYLQQFAEKGGKVLFAGHVPEYIDAVLSNAAQKLAENNRIDFTRNAVVEALEPYRTVKMLNTDGGRTDDLFYGLRQDGENYNLFVCHCTQSNRLSIKPNRVNTIGVKGTFTATEFNTLTGKTAEIPVYYENGFTCFKWQNNVHSSLLVQLCPGKAKPVAENTAEYEEQGYVAGPVEYALAEPNVCVLDMARWRLDDGDWQKAEESIRIGVIAKQQLNLPVAASLGAQPWATKKVKEQNTITLAYSFYSEIEVQNAKLALEDLDCTEVWFNGQKLPAKKQGYYVDFSIAEILLGTVQKGQNTIELKKPFGVMTNTENIFVLGNFGVRVTGTAVCLQKPAEKLYFADLAQQGLPFYGGEITYRLPLKTNQSTALALGTYGAGCVTVTAGGVGQNVSLAPYVANLGYLAPGQNTVEVHVYNSRANTFGQLHLNNGDHTWFGPPAWRTQGAEYCPEYRLKATGLLSAPRILKKR